MRKVIGPLFDPTLHFSLIIGFVIVLGFFVRAWNGDDQPKPDDMFSYSVVISQPDDPDDLN